jgi:tetratricopeptide (TPR) repeat protein/cellulose biosynthesis protein BcsQ
MTPLSQTKQCVFVTFYSFKGGVGRSMALLNVASILAGRGRRVLMIDFDLEAPGITLLQEKQSTGEPTIWKAGLVELVEDFVKSPHESALVDQKNSIRLQDEYITSIAIPEKLKRSENGYLHMMPCGRLDNTYEKRLYNIKFDKLYEEGIGLPLFKHFKNVIKNSGLYDYVLVDSRTGLSDEGSICTRDLADYLVVIMGLNRQNVEGTARVLRQLKEGGWKGGRVICVASPMPVHYEELRNSRMEAARQAIEHSGLNVKLDLHIPYHPRLALDEDLLIYDWSQTDLFSAYEALQSAVRSLAKDTQETWVENVVNEINQSRAGEAVHWLREILVESPDTANNLLAIITNAQQNRFPKQIDLASLFSFWLEFADNKALVYQRYGQSLIAQSKYEEAIQQLNQALNIANHQQDIDQERTIRTVLGEAYYHIGKLDESLQEFHRSLGNEQNAQNSYIQFWIGQVHQARGNYELALETYQKALEAQEAIGNQRGAAATRTSIGQIHQARGNYELALEAHQKAFEVQEAIGDQQNAAATRGSIGQIHQARGNYELALEAYQKALEVQEAIGDQRGAAVARSSIGDVHQARGNYELALEAHQKALEVQEAIGDQRGAAATRGSIGDVHQARGNYELALEAYQKVLEVQEAIGDQRGAAATRTSIGQIHQARGNYELALETYQKVLEVQEAIGGQRGAAVARGSIGQIHQARGNYELALEAHQKALEVLEAIGDQQNAAATLSEIGNVEITTGEIDSGIQKLEMAIHIFIEIGAKPSEIETHTDYAKALFKLGKTSEAIKYLNNHWQLIEQFALGDLRANAFAIRAKIKEKLGDIAGSQEDAEVAASFYREQNVHTELAKEMAEILSTVSSKS